MRNRCLKLKTMGFFSFLKPVANFIGKNLPVIGGAVSGLLGGRSVSRANEANIEWAREQMNTQRSWALEDWNRNNQYNSPEAQMQRLKDAGLNPNLVYGGANAIQAAAPIRATESGKPNIQPVPAMVESMLSGFLSMYDLQKIQAETDNIKAQKDLIDANIRNRNLDAKTKEVSLDYYPEFLKFRNKQAGININSSLQKMDLAQMANKRADDLAQSVIAKNAKSVEQMAEQMLLTAAQTSKIGIEKEMLSQQIKNLKQDFTLKQLDINLRKAGLTYNDPLVTRIVSRYITLPEGQKKAISTALSTNPLQGMGLISWLLEKL